jgi:hypothetical protein
VALGCQRGRRKKNVLLRVTVILGRGPIARLGRIGPLGPFHIFFISFLFLFLFLDLFQFLLQTWFKLIQTNPYIIPIFNTMFQNNNKQVLKTKRCFSIKLYEHSLEVLLA